MSFPDDQASPAAPFSGDGTGEIFDQPDIVYQSPTTSERIVDTQSGYLVVLKAVEQGRQCLYVKRRLGTPPSSSILLTRDEALKLSRILVGGGKPAAETPDNLSGLARRGTAREAYEAASKPRARNYKRDLVRGPMGLVFLTAILLMGVIAFAMQSSKPNIVTLKTPPPVVNILESAIVERFSRDFVGDMLDFNPDTYRISQVRAMAVMAPDLFKSYWKDTHFPLSPNDLKRIPQGNSIVVKKISQTRVDTDKVEVNVFGELTGGGAVSPIHIRLKVIATPDKQLQVIDQDDVTTE
jgi:hypothetical protein